MAVRTCIKCGRKGKDVKKRYSYSIYAGRLCRSCCFVYRDNCGVDRKQGNPSELDEPYFSEEEL